MSNEKFEYTDSAEKQAEINAIKQKYMPKQTDDTEDAMKRLRKLDTSCERTAQITALTVGIAGILIFGLGLTFCLEWSNMILGIVLMVIGAAIAIPAKFIYDKVLKSRREKAAPEILRLSELLENGK